MLPIYMYMRCDVGCLVIPMDKYQQCHDIIELALADFWAAFFEM